MVSLKMLKFLLFLAIAVVACGAATIKDPKDDRGIIRPCAFKDLRCIRDNIAANSKCNKKVRGSIPVAYNITNFRFETPYFNASYVDEYVTIRNHNNCHVSEFFFNMDADSAVLALDCPNLGVAANRSLIQHWSLKEDTTYSYTIDGVYPLVRLTTNLRHADRMDLCSAHVLADVTTLPVFKVDPNNKPTANFLSPDLTFLNIYERETFFYRAPLLFKMFINSVICDFGCNL